MCSKKIQGSEVQHISFTLFIPPPHLNWTPPTTKRVFFCGTFICRCGAENMQLRLGFENQDTLKKKAFTKIRNEWAIGPLSHHSEIEDLTTTRPSRVHKHTCYTSFVLTSYQSGPPKRRRPRHTCEAFDSRKWHHCNNGWHSNISNALWLCCSTLWSAHLNTVRRLDFRRACFLTPCWN